MQVNLKESGTFIFTTESVGPNFDSSGFLRLTLENISQYHVKENWESDAPQGWLARDHDDWCTSHQMIKGLAKVSRCRFPFDPPSLKLTMVLANKRKRRTWPLCGDVLEAQGGTGIVHIVVDGFRHRCYLPACRSGVSAIHGWRLYVR